MTAALQRQQPLNLADSAAHSFPSTAAAMASFRHAPQGQYHLHCAHADDTALTAVTSPPTVLPLCRLPAAGFFTAHETLNRLPEEVYSQMVSGGEQEGMQMASVVRPDSKLTAAVFRSLCFGSCSICCSRPHRRVAPCLQLPMWRSVMRVLLRQLTRKGLHQFE